MSEQGVVGESMGKRVVGESMSEQEVVGESMSEYGRWVSQ